jgi:hypothetical protein
MPAAISNSAARVSTYQTLGPRKNIRRESISNLLLTAQIGVYSTDSLELYRSPARDGSSIYNKRFPELAIRQAPSHATLFAFNSPSGTLIPPTL